MTDDGLATVGYEVLKGRGSARVRRFGKSES
jgi:hypothetical protein